ncbi:MULTISPECIES: DUF2272 domain-containing protein [unclassified Luteimonas]|uniref:DUF2272 domain-containing protein n=1 Tax=unclassified Luteimonas TaxID=2629088 RepID=UPI0016003671|nr:MULTISPECIES: DUF2272 domain-containing protein [unclassified Luteimonas]MBB1472017.1 DUF2272 domain-containing protein [Luteimonas sp. MC1782]MBB6599258.1 DUF2272 domain-containing protein [Luteimonas sp. MC1825]QOC89373.1 DUF2272 domain-containing protein [Luteimonas sp. MC1825]
MARPSAWQLLVCAATLWLLGAAGTAQAADPCPLLRAQTGSPAIVTRIAAVACEEHQLWYRPFIDREGRLAGSQVREAEAALLANGQPAWLRVADYWRGSGLLYQALQRPGANDCVQANGAYAAPACRAFIVDTPWSAAFVSWVLGRAALPGFRGSASHVGYVRDAYRDPEGSAYRVADPRAVRPGQGDLLCYVRVAARSYGFPGLASLLSSDDSGLGMHCDIVVAAQPGDATAYLVGGNVLDGVTMRLLPLTPGGQFAELPTRPVDGASCTPDTPAGCSANRQDWAVLLQLRPAQELAGLAPARAVLPPAMAPSSPRCCVNCVVGSGVPRCPASRPLNQGQ